MKIHFIAIGGSAMHNLAIALHRKKYTITGSDDEIFEPSRSRLATYGLLPEKTGWNPGNIAPELDAVILGMHARPDNPELLKAQELGIKVYSYPEYLYEQTKDKKRVVIGGSHGKTTITAMVMHVLNYHGVKFDYMVGANIEGFDTMVGLSDEAKIAVFEGDEYLSSPINRRPKFHLYHPHIALITGISWDHINVFPTFEGYVEQFQIFADLIRPSGKLIYYSGDNHLKEIAEKTKKEIATIPYDVHPHKIENGVTYLMGNNQCIKLEIFGAHNLQNINGARLVCKELGITDERFYKAIALFKGASRRLQVVAKNEHTVVYHDFAHSPSKLKATTHAVKAQFPQRKLVACMELHTFSSLKKEFLPHYNGSMGDADVAYVYFNPHTVEHKKLEPITKQQVKEGFGNSSIRVFTDADQLFEALLALNWNNTNLLLMSSGNFSGKDVEVLAQSITGNE